MFSRFNAFARTVAPRRRVMPRRAFLGAVTAALLAACGPSESGTPPTSPVTRPRATSIAATILEGWRAAAGTEGAVQVYADLGRREADDLTRLLARRYPNLRVEWTLGSDRALLARARAERASGGGTWDVFVGDAAPTLAGTDGAARWAPPEAVAIGPELVDPHGQWFALALTHHVLEYNPELVPFTSRPTAYETLRESRFLGRLAVEDESLTWS